MKKIQHFLLPTSLVILANFAMAQSIAPTISDNNPWYISAGMSYAFVSDTGNASGNIETTDVPDIYFRVDHSALHYSHQLSPELLLGYSFTPYFDLAGLYSEVHTNISSSSIPSNSIFYPDGAYTSQATMNNFLLQPRLIWRDATHIGLVYLSPYAALDIGTTSIQLSHQNVYLNGQEFDNHLAKKSQWNFAWGGELGVINSLSQQIDLSLGLRYLNYGKFNSGTQEVDYPAAPMVQAVQATLYSISPFIDLSYRF